MNKIKEVIRDLITAVKLQKMAQDSELLKDLYGTIAIDTLLKRKENYQNVKRTSKSSYKFIRFNER